MALISGTMSHSVPLDHCCSCVSAFNLITDLPLCVSIFIKIWCSQSFQEQVYTFGLNGNADRFVSGITSFLSFISVLEFF